MKKIFQNLSILLLLVQSAYTISLYNDATRGSDGSLLFFLGAFAYIIVGLPVGIYWTIQSIRQFANKTDTKLGIGLLILGLIGIATYPVLMLIFSNKLL